MTISMTGVAWVYSDLFVGDYAILVLRTNVITGEKHYMLYPDNGVGIAGNMKPEIRRYHGWLGTTNNISVKALGLRMIIAAHVCKNGRVRVWITKDLNPDVD